jgi:hypothetical protein
VVASYASQNTAAFNICLDLVSFSLSGCDFKAYQLSRPLQLSYVTFTFFIHLSHLSILSWRLGHCGKLHPVHMKAYTHKHTRSSL